MTRTRLNSILTSSVRHHPRTRRPRLSSPLSSSLPSRLLLRIGPLATCIADLVARRPSLSRRSPPTPHPLFRDEVTILRRRNNLSRSASNHFLAAPISRSAWPSHPPHPFSRYATIPLSTAHTHTPSSSSRHILPSPHRLIRPSPLLLLCTSKHLELRAQCLRHHHRCSFCPVSVPYVLPVPLTFWLLLVPWAGGTATTSHLPNS